MSEENKEGRNEAQANPYNMNKSWHTDKVMPTELKNADSGLFVPNPDSCLLYTSPSPRDRTRSRMPSSA